MQDLAPGGPISDSPAPPIWVWTSSFSVYAPRGGTSPARGATRSGARQRPRRDATLAIYMGGGPAAVYGGDALRAYNQFSGPKAFNGSGTIDLLDLKADLRSVLNRSHFFKVNIFAGQRQDGVSALNFERSVEARHERRCLPQKRWIVADATLQSI